MVNKIKAITHLALLASIVAISVVIDQVPFKGKKMVDKVSDIVCITICCTSLPSASSDVPEMLNTVTTKNENKKPANPVSNNTTVSFMCNSSILYYILFYLKNVIVAIGHFKL